MTLEYGQSYTMKEKTESIEEIPQKPVLVEILNLLSTLIEINLKEAAASQELSNKVFEKLNTIFNDNNPIIRENVELGYSPDKIQSDCITAEILHKISILFNIYKMTSEINEEHQANLNLLNKII